MSGRGGGGSQNNINNNGSNNSNNNGKQQQGSGSIIIPAGAKKIVQSLKEIVNNVSESEIFAALKDCDMDPNEAINRLLSQDTFQEVKSKREKKRENKDITDIRSRNRAGRGSLDHHGRGGSTPYNSYDSGILQGKPAYRKENGTHAYTGSSSAIAGTNINRRPPVHSDYVATENKTSHAAPVDPAFSTSQTSSGFQSAWLGVPGQVSMADVVKMGRPQNEASSLAPHQSTIHHHGPASTSISVAMDHGSHSSDNHASKISEINLEPEVAPNHNFDADDEWPSIEPPPAAGMSSVLEVPADSELYIEQSNLHLDRGHLNMKSPIEDVQSAEEDHTETLNRNDIRPVSVASRNMQEDESGASSLFDNSLYRNANSYHSHAHAFKQNDVENGASTVAANFQQLSLQNDDQTEAPEEDNPSVIIPNHLQVHGQDCSHLSFGSFGSGIGSALSGPFSSRSLKHELKETSEVMDGPSTALSDARHPDYYEDDHLRSTADENLMHRASVNAAAYDSTSVQQPEVLKEENPEPSQGSQYAYPSSAPGYSYESTQQLAAAFHDPQTSSQMPNVAHFSNVMGYTNSLPSTLLSSTVQTGREPDLSYSPFSVTLSMATKYSNAASAISGPSISMSEALRAASISTAQPTQQTLAGTGIATGPALPQQLPMHPYSQPTLPMGHFANMIGYPFLPQSYTYMPSAFQQTLAGNNTYPQSLAAMLPQFKNNVSVSSLPQSAAVASGYGFGSSNSIPGGNFPLNPPSGPTGTNLGYDDLLSSQYKEGNHLMSLQQNENSAMWVQGPGSRTMSGVPGGTYYSFQGQNQQAAGFRQAQQPSQQFGALGYPNYYQTAALSLEHQQQNSRDGSLVGSQGQPSKQTQQLWQSSY